MQKTSDSTRYKSIVSASGLSGKTLTDVQIVQHGCVSVVEISFSGGQVLLKERQGVWEFGGTLDFGTGTPVF